MQSASQTIHALGSFRIALPPRVQLATRPQATAAAPEPCRAAHEMDEVLALLRGAGGLAGPAIQARLAASAPRSPSSAARLRLAAQSLLRIAASPLPSLGRATRSCPLPRRSTSARTSSTPSTASPRAGLPAMFVYLFDQPWRLGEEVCARVSAMIGQRYEVVEDVWAWRIAPGNGRGLASASRDRRAAPRSRCAAAPQRLGRAERRRDRSRVHVLRPARRRSVLSGPARRARRSGVRRARGARRSRGPRSRGTRTSSTGVANARHRRERRA